MPLRNGNNTRSVFTLYIAAKEQIKKNLFLPFLHSRRCIFSTHYCLTADPNCFDNFSHIVHVKGGNFIALFMIIGFIIHFGSTYRMCRNPEGSKGCIV